MILDACREIYVKDGFLGVTFNTVAEKTTFTRPALYNYYRNREEMLMDVLMCEWTQWSEGLLEELETKKPTTKEEFCRVIADRAESSKTVFKLLAARSLIERGCTVERVAEFRITLNRHREYFIEYLRGMVPEVDEDTLEAYLDNCLLLVFGAFSCTCTTEHQDEALRLAAAELPAQKTKSMFYRALLCATSAIM